jgi:hypothetical protein
MTRLRLQRNGWGVKLVAMESGRRGDRRDMCECDGNGREDVGKIGLQLTDSLKLRLANDARRS